MEAGKENCIPVSVAESETRKRQRKADQNSLEFGKIIDNAFVIVEKNMHKSKLIGE